MSKGLEEPDKASISNVEISVATMEHAVLQAEQSQVSQPFLLLGEVFNPSAHFCCLPLDLLHVYLVEVEMLLEELFSLSEKCVGKL